ncbi:MAG: hypothetical protein R6V67_03025 [Spirochaetia bacterium]
MYLRIAVSRTLLLLFFLLLLSCTGEAPEITRTFWQLDIHYSPEEDTQNERLTVFAQVRDRDGHSDIDRWTLHMPEKELFWRRDSEEWIESTEGDEHWIGWNGISAPADSPLPRGEYILEIEDKAGESTESSFNISHRIEGLTEGPLDMEEFPHLSFSEGGAYIRSPYSVHTIAVSDGEGKTLEVFEHESSRINEEELSRQRSIGGVYITLGGFDESGGFGVKSGPYRIPEE